MNTNKVYYFHLYDGNQKRTLKGGLTFAFMLEETGVGDSRVIKYGYAQCSKKDPFTKEIGRKIAYGRLCKHPVPAYVPSAEFKDAIPVLLDIVRKEQPSKHIQRLLNRTGD